mmetsp:Transcript_6135/g.11651  ORF Transcript_6135/g.11651 Transcript_6135/m.11651 type:complete len:110 (-) Transcript_6135:18-347(-)
MARDGSATAAAPSAALGLAIFAVIPIAASLYARQKRKRDEERRRAASRHRSSVYEEFRGKVRPMHGYAVLLSNNFDLCNNSVLCWRGVGSMSFSHSFYANSFFSTSSVP